MAIGAVLIKILHMDKIYVDSDEGHLKDLWSYGQLPWLLVSARLDGEDSREECARGTCPVGSAHFMLAAGLWRQELGVTIIELEVGTQRLLAQHHQRGSKLSSAVAREGTSSMALWF